MAGAASGGDDTCELELVAYMSELGVKEDAAKIRSSLWEFRSHIFALMRNHKSEKSRFEASSSKAGKRKCSEEIEDTGPFPSPMIKKAKIGSEIETVGLSDSTLAFNNTRSVRFMRCVQIFAVPGDKINQMIDRVRAERFDLSGKNVITQILSNNVHVKLPTFCSPQGFEQYAKDKYNSLIDELQKSGPKQILLCPVPPFDEELSEYVQVANSVMRGLSQQYGNVIAVEVEYDPLTLRGRHLGPENLDRLLSAIEEQGSIVVREH